MQSASSSASCSRLEVCTKNSSKPLKASPPDPESLASSSDRPSNRRSAYAALVREMLALCDHTWSRVVLPVSVCLCVVVFLAHRVRLGVHTDECGLAPSLLVCLSWQGAASNAAQALRRPQRRPFEFQYGNDCATLLNSGNWTGRPPARWELSELSGVVRINPRRLHLGRHLVSRPLTALGTTQLPRTAQPSDVRRGCPGELAVVGRGAAVRGQPAGSGGAARRPGPPLGRRGRRLHRPLLLRRAAAPAVQQPCVAAAAASFGSPPAPSSPLCAGRRQRRSR